MRRTLCGAFAATLLVTTAGPTLSASPPATWDDLTRVQSRNLSAVYLLPGENFCAYKRVKLDTPQVAFRQNWLRDFNRTTVGLSQRLTQADADRVMEEVRTGFAQILTKAYTDAGFEVVNTPGHDVLQVGTAIANLAVSAPDRMQAGRSRTFAREAGSATLVVEARDSMTGAVLGRAVDSRIAGDTGSALRNRVTNRADFSRLFTTWGRAAANGLTELRNRSGGCPTPAAAKK
ncbi:MAG TPA: DUF3313 family protein [Phenylobacterium sp.]|jgi:hypothetical protein